MTRLHVVAKPRLVPAGRSGVLRSLSCLIDSARPGDRLSELSEDSEACALLGELAGAAASLFRGRRTRAVVQTYADRDAWELALEAHGDSVLLSVLRAGSAPEVTVFEREVAAAALRHALLDALGTATRLTGATPRLAEAATALAESWPPRAMPRLERRAIELPVAPDGLLGIGASSALRVTLARPRSNDGAVEHADLHALLGLGTLRFLCRTHVLEVPGVQLFLTAERLIGLAHEALDAAGAEGTLFRRITSGPLRVGVRKIPGRDTLSLTLGGADSASARTFPELPPAALVQAVHAFAMNLTRALTKCDRAQRRNLRLLAMEQQAADLWTRLQDLGAGDSLTNPEPESYRAFAPASAVQATTGAWERGGKMRFTARWAATVPNIELGSLFLCGDRLLVSSARETAALDVERGEVVWKVSTERAVSVLTSSGLARIHPDGRVDLHELDTGALRWSRVLKPRVPRGTSGSVFDAPGLPKLLVMAEGDRELTAIDLVTGGVRWRHRARKAGCYRLQRAGKLVLVTGSDSALLALDASTGELVWRLCDALPFVLSPVVSRDSVFALSGTGATARLHHVDAWRGEVHWQAPFGDSPAASTSLLVNDHTVLVVTEDSTGLGLAALARDGGRRLWTAPPGLVKRGSEWLLVDELVYANGPGGVLLCADATTGATRFSQVFPRGVEADEPRQARPVLRNGALFVPQHRVHVVAPRTGELVGTLPTDLIPDAMLVDERCGVYVAEESGHLAAFTTGPRLSLVQG